MKKHIISIGRQYGCGAHEIATKLSEKLGIPYYDKEIIKRAAKDSGFDEHIFTFYDERPTRSFLYNVSTDGFSNIASNGLALEDQVFQYQFDTIRKVAEEGSCIIVTIFLHASDKFREKRVIEKYGVEPKNVAKEMKNTDKKRAKFHNFYSEEKWGEATTYDLAINVAKLGIDGTVDLISEYIKAQG